MIPATEIACRCAIVFCQTIDAITWPHGMNNQLIIESRLVVATMMPRDFEFLSESNTAAVHAIVELDEPLVNGKSLGNFAK